MKSELEKMLAGELYTCGDPELSAMRRKARLLTGALNATKDDETEERKRILADLFQCDPANVPWIEPPFYCDYGVHIEMGPNVFFNFNCVVLDICKVTIGEGTLFAPGVQIYAATHPLDWRQRAAGLENGKPVTIGKHVWVGGNVIICPGVTIGDHAVIGAGSVVTRDIPADTLAVGNPCRVVRELTSG